MSVRSFTRNRVQTQEEESVFITMTDMTISFLLIVMILLAFFATLLKNDDVVSRVSYDIVLAQLRDAQNEVDRLEFAVVNLTRERDVAILEGSRLRKINNLFLARIEYLEEELSRLREELKITISERNFLREELKRMKEVNPLEDYLSRAIEQRRKILVQLRDRLLFKFPDLEVVISPEQDALRFQGEGLFQSGSSQLQHHQLGVVQEMGRLLDDILTCYTLGDRAARVPSCGSGDALIEAVQIEGHTDHVGSDKDNLVLSTNRANRTFIAILNETEDILDHENIRSQPVMSVSGYGEMRPVATNATDEGKAANRRIDLRIIMYTPSTLEEVEEIGRRLDTLRMTARQE